MADLYPFIWYRRPKAAIRWLEEAFGFETRLLVEDPETAPDAVIHSELHIGDGKVGVVGPPRDQSASPEDIGGRVTAAIHVQLDGGIDAHCERARGAGALIEREPADMPYGDRVYTCRDPEGHAWSFGQTNATMTGDEVAEATGHVVRETR